MNMTKKIEFTDLALKQIDKIVLENSPKKYFRISVLGGGCSGFSYGFTFDEITNDDDAMITKNGVSLLIDSMSYQFLMGADIDYKNDLEGSQFVIKNNPGAKSTCGCGSSFTT